MRLRAHRVRWVPLARTVTGTRRRRRRNKARLIPHESIQRLYPPPGRHRPTDGGDHAGRARRTAFSAAVRAARSRLPDHPGADVLSGREPGCDDVVGDGTARAPVRADAVAEPDVVAK